MEKNAIKNYAIYARNKLRQSTIDMASIIGITEKGIQEPVSKGSNFEIYKSTIGTETILDASKIQQRENLIKQIKEKGFDQVIEEVAYTWFNRLIAIRFMEVNDYLPSRTRVLSSETEGKAESDLMTDPFNAGFDFSDAQKELIIEYKDNNNTDELFKLLFIAQCNELSKILSGLFEGTDEYTELLFNIKYNDKEDVVYKLVNDIPESDFNVEQEGQIEIIGWMYQFYNEEWKNQVNKEKQKIDRNNIPAVTQLFTPDWIVKYMVENSLGRFYLDGYPESTLQTTWKYYLEEAEQEESVKRELEKIKEEHRIPVEEIKLIDPCMGSGHILVYAFDVFMQMYVEQGWSERDASISILENNIFGLDIDKRAYQLSYFALMMKARQYNKRLFRRYVEPNVLVIQESNGIDTEYLEKFGDLRPLAVKLVHNFKDAREYGSILNINLTREELDLLDKKLDEIDEMSEYGSFPVQLFDYELISGFVPLIKQAKIMSNLYEITITNPPYMVPSGLQKPYVEKYYKEGKADLCAVFIQKLHEMTIKNGYQAMITMHSWMFLSSFEKLREQILLNNTIINMAHLGARAFEEIGGEVVQTVSMVLLKENVGLYNSKYTRQVEEKTPCDKEKAFLQQSSIFVSKGNKYNYIPGTPLAYWVSIDFVNCFKQYNAFSEFANAKAGLSTTDNNRFLRLWFEISNRKIGFNYRNLDETKDCKYMYIPEPKGGSFRKWYGNLDYVVNWFNNGSDIRKAAEGASGGRIVGSEYYFKKGITWSDITSGGNISARFMPSGMIFNSSAPSAFCKDDGYINYIIGYMNTKIAKEFLLFLAPSYHFNAGPISKLPLVVDNDKKNIIDYLSNECILSSKIDWDSYETSWDFTVHPMIRGLNSVESSYLEWKSECNSRFNQLKDNEEELNRIFIDIYGLNDELDPYVEDKDVTVHYVVDKKEDASFSSNYVRTREDEIKSLISYAVGCMFGRYSLDVEGLAYAGGEFDSSKYSSFIPDSDNIIPIREESYYEEDDIVDRFVEFIKVAYGESTLEENLKFIADSLSNKGTTSREVIRNYFINDFFKDHCATYQVTGSGKRPIYWLFDSGKQNGFKALIYMHRYNEDTVSKVRTDYLHKVQSIYEQGIKDDTYTIENAANKADITKARKHRDKLEKQLAETRIYDQALAHIANERISIDLDDGVKVNYAKFQGVEVINEGSKKINVDLLAKFK